MAGGADRGAVFTSGQLGNYEPKVPETPSNQPGQYYLTINEQVLPFISYFDLKIIEKSIEMEFMIVGERGEPVYPTDPQAQELSRAANNEFGFNTLVFIVFGCIETLWMISSILGCIQIRLWYDLDESNDSRQQNGWVS